MESGPRGHGWKVGASVVTALALAWGLHHSSAATPWSPEPQPEKLAEAPLPPPTARVPARFGLGINEAISVPQRMLLSGELAGPALADRLAADAAHTTRLGARYVRGNTGAFPRTSWWASQAGAGGTADADVWVQAVQAAGLEPILMVSPWPGNRTANATETYVPADLEAYTRWVQQLVERYDADGIDDMPGLLAPIRYWEVDNEPDLKFTAPPRDARRRVPPGTFCYPEEAAAVLIATATAIRAAQPEAHVLNGGLFRPFTRSGQDYLREMLVVPGAAAAFDILSLHTYASDEHGDTLAKGIRAARAIAGDRPVWITETSVASDGGERWMNAAWQARMVATSVARAAAEGASVLLWHSLADPPVDRKTGFEHHSLLRTAPDGTVSDKPAAPVFRALADRLAEDDIRGARYDGTGAVRLSSGALLVYEGSRVTTSGGVSLTDGAAVAPGAQAEAPAWLWP